MRQKGFGIIPVLLILLLTGAITASGYLYFFSKEEDRNPNSYQPALNSETPLPSPTISPVPSPTISPAAIQKGDLTLEEIKKLESNIAWGEATESIITDFYAEEKPKGKVMKGT